MMKLLSIAMLMESFSEVKRELPASPVFFGVFTFAVLMLMLYLVLRLDRD
ncbi:MAG: hypothetical protein KGN03_03665 [Acidobacteria bacterium]|nr:hypothetical protein [Acidobacteriota bacterium]